MVATHTSFTKKIVSIRYHGKDFSFESGGAPVAAARCGADILLDVARADSWSLAVFQCAWGDLVFFATLPKHGRATLPMEWKYKAARLRFEFSAL